MFYKKSYFHFKDDQKYGISFYVVKFVMIAYHTERITNLEIPKYFCCLKKRLKTAFQFFYASSVITLEIEIRQKAGLSVFPNLTCCCFNAYMRLYETYMCTFVHKGSFEAQWYTSHTTTWAKM